MAKTAKRRTKGQNDQPGTHGKRRDPANQSTGPDRRADLRRAWPTRSTGEIRRTSARRREETAGAESAGETPAHRERVQGRARRQADRASGRARARHQRPVPGRPPAAALDTAALAAAEDQHDSLQVSATYLALEAQEAATEAGKAMDAVRAAAVAVMDHDAKRIVGELIAARDIFWKLTEQASGFFLVDARRPGGPKFAAAPGHYLPRRAKSEN